MLDILEKLINFIEEQYTYTNSLWIHSDKYVPINLKKKQINHIYDEENNNIMNTVLEYQSFMNEKILVISLELHRIEWEKCKINSRVKANNSIEDKIDRYCKKKERGKVPINSCFNDLLGFRIILYEKIDYDVIQKFIKSHFPKLKCINSSKDEYKAIHVYFYIDNFSLPWELQIWNIEDEQTNLESHKKYKQDYTNWENENRGGDSVG